MKIELYENEFNYILRCFQELFPMYCKEMKETLYIDNPIHNGKKIYVFELNLINEDIETIKELKMKLKNHKNIDEFNLYDDLNEFFFFIENYIAKL